jgi:hypothetical protein
MNAFMGATGERISPLSCLACTLWCAVAVAGEGSRGEQSCVGRMPSVHVVSLVFVLHDSRVPSSRMLTTQRRAHHWRNTLASQASPWRRKEYLLLNSIYLTPMLCSCRLPCLSSYASRRSHHQLFTSFTPLTAPTPTPIILSLRLSPL